GDDVGDVDHRAGHVVVEPVPFEQPAPAAAAKLVEGASLDQVQRCLEVLDAIGAAAGDGPSTEPAEEVDVDQQAEHLVDVHATFAGGGGVLDVRDVQFPRDRVGAEPVTAPADV